MTEKKITDNSAALMKMKQELDTKKTQLSTLQGKREILFQQLKDQFDCDSIEQADEKIASMDRELEEKKQRLNKGILALQEKYEWDFDNDNQSAA